MQIYDQLSLLSSNTTNSRVSPIHSAFAKNIQKKQNLKNKTASKPSSHCRSHITELVISKFCSNLEQMLLPMLSFQTQSNNNRWVTWVSNNTIDKNLLLDFGVELDFLRMIYPKNQTDLFSLTSKALSTGNSQCVVSIFDSITEQQRIELNKAAELGQCTGILVTLRN
ncbi:SulA-like leucine-rich domain-containing protein [Sessilibacter corallicola]|uniref:SulA-like leucine-rich domain-containing protein n=1 Tax=Sessilibacter corallicola TaxID=2904075 RepID=UPI001E31B08D|nr:SulA-like leucine-rich domain-containing protein [Sessilibacter corallicola]MCE2026893.1 hypothetical protein [Sessilibacter corallicola]